MTAYRGTPAPSWKPTVTAASRPSAGESKTDRPLAQQALATVPDKTAKILVALGDGRQGTRAAAAGWLGEVGDPAAIEPMKEAFRKEKQEVVKGAIMSALDALGADVN